LTQHMAARWQRYAISAPVRPLVALANSAARLSSASCGSSFSPRR
jgi:hypothetical protein